MAAVEFIRDLCTPALIIDLDKVNRNAQGMLERFHKLGPQLRPHMKTHKTLWDSAQHQPLEPCFNEHPYHASLLH